ncbi:MAG: HD domain-containing phosphohydrolase [Candidatus Omnitrophota bacterium]
MVDFHKGFEGFERLEPSDKKENKDEVSWSKHAEEKDMLLGANSDLAKAETVYSNILNFITPIFDRIKEGKEGQIKGEEILGWTQEFTDIFRSSITPDDMVRLAFHHDDYKDNYIYTHSVNVCLLSARMALALNFSKSRLFDLVIASLFHDIGMMKIPLEIWNKDGRLSSSEREEIKKHVIYGEEIFSKLNGINEVIPVIIGQHQEYCDGTGYPKGLKKDSIHYGARLVSLIHSYESATHTRLYRPCVLPDKAIQQILDNESAKYDRHFLKTLLRSISIFPVGSWVKISSGEIGNVVRISEDTPMRPAIKICYNREGYPLPESRMLDLSKQLLIHVERCIDIEEVKKEGM